MPCSLRTTASFLASAGRWLVYATIAGIAIGSGCIAVSAVWQGWRTLTLMQAHNNLKGALMLLQEYHDQNGHFPSVTERNENGAVMHSWRSALLRDAPDLDDRGYLEKSKYQFSDYSFARPWNDPGNLAAGKAHPLARYPYQLLAIVGPDAAWDEQGVRKIEDFKDGLSKTALVIAVRDTGIPWYEPRDAVFDGEILWLGDPKDRRSLPLSEDVFLLMADGSVRYFAEGLSPSRMKSFCTIASDDDPPQDW